MRDSVKLVLVGLVLFAFGIAFMVAGDACRGLRYPPAPGPVWEGRLTVDVGAALGITGYCIWGTGFMLIMLGTIMYVHEKYEEREQVPWR